MDLQNKVITIVSTETKLTNTGKTMIKIKDQNNLTYQVWQLKQDGSESVAYQGLQNLGEPVGKTIEIGYKEDQGDFQGKAITYRTIVNIRLTDKQPSQGEQRIKAQISEAGQKNTDDKWAEISKGKVRHGVACEFIRLGHEYEPATISKINKWTEFIMSGELFNKQDDLTPATEDDIIKEMQDEEEVIQVEKIPF